MSSRKTLLITLFALMLAGCGASKKNLNPSLDPFGPGGGRTPTPEAPDSPGSGEDNSFKTGHTVDFVPVSDAVMRQFTMRPLNDVKDVKINVTLDDFNGNGAFGGFFKIRYTDGSHVQTNEFNAGKNESDIRYNQWFYDSSGKRVWHGMFEDEYGGMVLVIDQSIDLGDGGGAGIVGGSVWFKNHDSSGAPNPSVGCLPGFGCPDTRCWFVEAGPYDCRTFLIGDEVRSTAMVNPNNGYIKLGTFAGLDRAKAFNE